MTDARGEWLFLDLETDLEGNIFKVAAVFRDEDVSLSGPRCVDQARPRLDAWAAVACGVAGHNIIDHDLPLLRQQHPALRLLTIPVVDTLYLSPICFAENPYHRLVKDYKLVPQSRNDPLLDARLSASLLTDERLAMDVLFRSAPEIMTSIDGLLGSLQDPGMAEGWRRIWPALPGSGNGPASFPEPLSNLVCRSALAGWTMERRTDESRWAMAYVLSWLRVSGARSVLPPWVRSRFPLTLQLLDELRDRPCDDPACSYCRTAFHPEGLLKQFFGFDAFRPEPQDQQGGSLQRSAVWAGMRNESLLAVLPTGGGKSLCFQLPAIARHVRRGQLTVVVSPLQALMKDQVDGLIRRTGLENAAALYGMLTLPERGDVLHRTAMGDVAILYLSPEQLRNRSVKQALASREIGCWVMDEAHCLSKWGHDFRPDYLYVGRYIRTLAAERNTQVPPIACFTATAKPDVIEEIIEYFRRETGTEMDLYQGGVERNNLAFEVQTVGGPGRLVRIEELLRERLGEPGAAEGCAVVFRATRRLTEETRDLLRQRGWKADAFHAGLTAPEKKEIQDAFIRGTTEVICATNAFGMGIDKDNVRVVIHGDTPGSLENYLQEAGRAGRDRARAECILLYSEEDCERQFQIGSLSELSRNDIAQILRGLRKASRQRSSEEVVITTGELLRDEDVATGFEADDRMADTKVRTAIAWLERAGLIERNDNQTSVIQAKPLVGSLAEAEQRIAKLELSRREADMWLAIMGLLMDRSISDSITVDQIALLPEFRGLMSGDEQAPRAVVRDGRSVEYVSARILRILHTMMHAELLKKETLLTAYIRYKVADHSLKRLSEALAVERALIGLLRELDPDPEGWMPLDTRLLNAELEARGDVSSPEMVGKVLKSMSEDGRGFAGQQGSLEMRAMGRGRYRVRVQRSWPVVAELSERRGRVASVILDTLFHKVPAGTGAKADLLISFSYEDLLIALNNDLVLRGELRDPMVAVERALMYLHEQGIIILQQGLSIFRSAMAIKVMPDKAAYKYTNEDYEALELHYRERIFQVHVMNAYAQAGLRKIDEALRLVFSYFSMSKEAFIGRVFRGKKAFLELATTERSYKKIVESLNNKDQRRVVIASPRRNMLILAGPGSGKTRVVVHRVAYLLRVRRVKPSAILVCCYNHKAAVELRRRLRELIDDDARGVMIGTYHSIALRLLGISARRRLEADADVAGIDFNRIIQDAVALLNEKAPRPGVEPDEVRDRLLAGFEHILVDEYQDIDEPQYELISALAGRTLEDTERKLTVLAVGDDDQNIYRFRGTHIAFIRRFQEDYEAEAMYLTENYRSTRNIIEASNAVISVNRDRMKANHPIVIDQGRLLLPAGGVFGTRDTVGRGRVVVLRARDMRGQAESVVREVLRLRALGVEAWSDMAVLARHRRDLACIRAEAEAQGVPVRWPLARDKIPPLQRIREVRELIDRLGEMRNAIMQHDAVSGLVPERPGNPWSHLVGRILASWRDEAGAEKFPAADALEYVYEALSQLRQDETWGEGIVLNTVHGAKGCEYRHVMLGGDWSMIREESREEERRLFYVGMTRARESLMVVTRDDAVNPYVQLMPEAVCIERDERRPTSRQVDEVDYELLGMADIFIGYAGWKSPHDPVHERLRALQPGDLIALRASGGSVDVVTKEGYTIGRLSKAAAVAWGPRLANVRKVTFLGAVVRYREDGSAENYQEKVQCDQWEVPWIEVEVLRKP